MKPKQFSKKLVLSKETIAHLGNIELSHANGGGVKEIIFTEYTCLAGTCPTDCPCPTQFTCNQPPNYNCPDV